MDDQTMLDRDNGTKLRDAIMATAADLPPISLQDRLLYAPDNPEFWQAVVQRLRLGGLKLKP